MGGYGGFTSGESLGVPSDMASQAGGWNPKRALLQALFGVAKANPTANPSLNNTNRLIIPAAVDA